MKQNVYKQQTNDEGCFIQAEKANCGLNGLKEDQQQKKV